MTTAVYSATPLAKKLGLKADFTIKLVNPPDNYFELFNDLPEGLDIQQDSKKVKDFIHVFAKDVSEMEQLRVLKTEMKQNGMIWVSWPKKPSRQMTTVTEHFIRHQAFKTGLVDIKVCAVDTLWAGLKLVIPVKDRK